MKRLLLIVSIAALALPASVLAKGPTAASMDGPGGGAITFSGDGESGGYPLGDLTQLAGFFPAAFGQEPDPLLSSRPSGDLGPKYTITYTVPGPSNEVDKLHQAIYPYAEAGPVTYMEPGQKFFGTEQTRGGWFQGDAQLKEVLVSAGLPAMAVAASSGGTTFQADLFVLLAFGLVLAAATVLVIRRRGRPATAG